MGWPLLGDDGSLMLMQLAAGLLSLRAWENDAGVCATQLDSFSHSRRRTTKNEAGQK